MSAKGHRLGSGQLEDPALVDEGVPGQEVCGDMCDVVGVDHRDGSVRLGRDDDALGAGVVGVAEDVGHREARP